MRFFASRRPIQVLCGVTLMGLAACSSGGSAAEEEELDAINRYFFGAKPDASAGNGLPFATPASTEADLIDARFEVPLINVRNGDTPDEAEIEVLSTEFVPSANFIDGTADEFTFIYEGETISYTGSGVDLGDGRGVLLSRYIEGRESLLMVGLYEDMATGAYYAFPVGPETSPVVVNALGGAGSLSGEFKLAGLVYDDDVLVGAGGLIEGDALLSVDFDAGIVSGIFESVPIAQDGGADWVLSGTMDPVAIDGNALTGTIAWRCSGVATCSDDADFGAVFTGPDAEEATGITSFTSEVELSDTMNTLDVRTVGGFIVNRSGI